MWSWCPCLHFIRIAERWPLKLRHLHHICILGCWHQLIGCQVLMSWSLPHLWIVKLWSDRCWRTEICRRERRIITPRTSICLKRCLWEMWMLLLIKSLYGKCKVLIFLLKALRHEVHNWITCNPCESTWLPTTCDLAVLLSLVGFFKSVHICEGEKNKRSLVSRNNWGLWMDKRVGSHQRIHQLIAVPVLPLVAATDAD